MPKITVTRLFDDNREKLALAWLAGRSGGATELDNEHVRESREGLIGHLNFIHPNWIQVVGRTELAHLSALTPAERQRILHDVAVSQDRKSTRLNSSHVSESRMPSSA